MSVAVEPILSGEALESQFSENSLTILRKRYLRRGPDGRPAESVTEMFRRVARHIAQAEEAWGGNVVEAEDLFYRLLTHLRFVPNSPTFTGAGTPLGQLAACFVLPIEDDMGRASGGIFQSLRDAALIQQTGGGNGFSFSRLRPEDSLVVSSMGKATGPIGFLRVYDKAFGEIAQGGCLTPDTLVFTEHGTLRLDELADPAQPGWREHCLTVATDEGPRLSTRTYNNGAAAVLRVATEAGIAITGTPEHKLKIMTADGPQWRSFKDLRPGDVVMAQLNAHRGQTQRLQHPTRRHENQILPRFPEELDEDLAFFVGCLIGDEFVASGEQDHRVGVRIAHGSFLIDEMPALIARLFGDELKAHTLQEEGDASLTLVIDERAVKDFLQMHGLAKVSSAEARIPRLIRQSPAAVVGAFLRGLFEANGNDVHGYPQLVSASEALIRETTTLLMGLGCPVHISRRPAGEDHPGEAPRWELRIVSPLGLERWRQHVGCDPRSRLMACHTFEPDPDCESSHPLPHAACEVRPVQIHEVFAAQARPADDLWFLRVQAVEEAGESLTLDLEVCDNHTYLANGLVTHNTRRGANMAVLRVDHPNIEQFISCKTSEDAITNFNISVGMLDAFMEAVEGDRPWSLRFPDVQDPAYRDFHGVLEDAEAAGLPIKTCKTVQARALFEKIVNQAWKNGEPGMLFLDAAQRDNPIPQLGRYESTNPCGEQFLMPYENCCLSSVNLVRHLGAREDGAPVLDWEKLAETTRIAIRFLDDVVSANAYVPAVPQLKEAAHRARRIGLGIMGLADLLYHLGARYGSEEAQELSAQVMEFIRYHAMLTGIELARERGPFPACEGSIYDPQNVTWRPRPWPEWLGGSPRHDWGRPAPDWDAVLKGIREHGIRNATQLTVAPTGTIATVAGAEGYGCEPAFALAYTRYVRDGDKQLPLRYVSPAFQRALAQAGLDPDRQERILEQVLLSGSCQDVEETPEDIRRVFVVASDIPAEGHIRMQAALQLFTDASISKTINFPATATPEDIAHAFQLAWQLGCKGLTVYVAGSREREVLETEAGRQQKRGEPAKEPGEQKPVPAWQNPNIRPRPKSLRGLTYQAQTPLGTAYVTVNTNGHGQPFEVFLNVGKAGSDTAAVAEAIGRLISLTLRLPSALEPRERLEEVVDQLSGIGGRRSLGFGHDRVLSLPDGVANVLNNYLEDSAEGDGHGAPSASRPDPEQPQLALFQVGDLCPACGQAALVNAEGCRRCYACGHSEC